MSGALMHPLEAILSMAAAAAPQPWFPRVYSEHTGTSWESLAYHLEILWLEGLIEKAGGTPEQGPGFTLTPRGLEVVHDPDLMELLRRGSVAGPDDRGATVRASLYQPPRPLATLALLAANVLFFAYGIYLAYPDGPTMQAYAIGPSLLTGRIANARVPAIWRELGSLTGIDLVRGEWGRVLRSGFLQFGLLHLAMNMYVLWNCGRLVEPLWGRWRFLLLYFTSLVGAALIAVANHPMVQSAGASGALCGLIASLAVWLWLNRRYLPRPMVSQLRSGLTKTFFLIVVISLLGGVSGWAHFGGALIGAAASFFLNYNRFGPAPWRWLALAGLPALLWLCAAYLDHVQTTDRTWQFLEQADFEKEPEPGHSSRGRAIANAAAR